MPLSPLLQTEEIKQKISAVRDELRRNQVYEIRESSAGFSDDIAILDRILGVIKNPETYEDGLKDGFTNNSIVDKLRGLGVLSDAETQSLKRCFRSKNPPKKLIPHT